MFPGSNGWPVRRADKLAAICKPIAYAMWDPHNPNRPPRPVTGTALCTSAFIQLRRVLVCHTHEGISQEAVMDCFKLILRHLPREAEENQENPKSV
jgi:hypothetical protein